jgi:quercetin dioxygenase-like cupin family protein
MEKVSLTAVARELSRTAASAGSGRAAETLHGGHASMLRQTVIALTAGSVLAEHENPGEATLVVLEGEVRLVSAEVSEEGRQGDLLAIPPARHRLEAVTDAAVLLTVAKRP